MQIPQHTFREMGLNEPMAILATWEVPHLYNIEEIHSHNFYDLLIFKKGGGTHIIDYQSESIQDCAIHIVSNNSTHKVERSKNAIGFSILISNLYLEQLQNFDNNIDYQTFFNQSRFINLTVEDFDSLNYLINELESQHDNRSYFFNILASFLSKLVYLSSKSTPIKPLDQQIKLFLSFIKENYLEKEILDKFIATYNLNKLTFTRKVKSDTGNTALQIIQEKLHLEAKKMLFNTDLSIKEISIQLGFEDESYFGKQFKKQEGIAPLAFRKKYK